MHALSTPGDAILAHNTGGAILYDALRVDQPGPELFDRGYWRARGCLQETLGGRGTVAFIRDGERRWVLRHYRRGGLVARLIDDTYLWSDEQRVRSLREWHLLRQLREWQLPVPVPVAAAYVRIGLVYRADLITEELPSRLTLAEAVKAAPLPPDRWGAIGRCIARFHARGVQHTDLNAHNIVLGASDEVYLLDFDNGQLRARGAWERRVLARLERSLRKVTAGLPDDRFGPSQWQALREGCAA